MSDGRIIGLISGKGGVGKTSVCVNLGVAMQEFGKEVTLVDADFSASNLGVHLGRYDHPVKIQDVLQGDADVSSAVFRHPTGVKAITASNEITQVEPDTSKLRKALEAASRNSDFVLVDCPPGLNSTVRSILDACDELLIVTMPLQTAGANAAQVIEEAKQQRKSILGTIVNKSENDPEREMVEREVEMMTESHILAEIPYDTKMKAALFHNEPLVLYEPLSKAAISIKQLAADLTGEKYEKPRFAKMKRKFSDLIDTFQN